MAEAAIEHRCQHIAITDHIKGLKIAGGSTRNAWSQQGHEIMELNRLGDDAIKRCARVCKPFFGLRELARSRRQPSSLLTKMRPGEFFQEASPLFERLGQ
jgi:hypothetical protein